MYKHDGDKKLDTILDNCRRALLAGKFVVILEDAEKFKKMYPK